MNLKEIIKQSTYKRFDEQVDLQDMNRIMSQLSKVDRQNFNKAVGNMKKTMENDGFDKKEVKEIFIFLLDAILT